MIATPTSAVCFHGGASYEWIGSSFDRLDQIDQVIDADVLDAWFSPSPKAIELMREYLPWLVRTSPPALPNGVELTISKQRGIPLANVVAGAGSSSLIYLALQSLLTPASRVLLLNPTYGEYAHVLSHVIGCQIDRFQLLPEDDYVVDLNKLVATMRSRLYDMVILVNPNNPTGKFITKDLLLQAIDSVPEETTVWVDEAYIDYVAADQSLEAYAAKKSNVIVCKSLSKVLAMSGLRAGYLCGHSSVVARLKVLTPPWSLTLPTQVALIAALQDHEYYGKCYAQTRVLREHLTLSLKQVLGFSPYVGTANFLLVDYPDRLPEAAAFLQLCGKRRLLLRDTRSMGNTTRNHSFRVAVKGSQTNENIVQILQEVCNASMPLHAQ